MILFLRLCGKTVFVLPFSLVLSFTHALERSGCSKSHFHGSGNQNSFSESPFLQKNRKRLTFSPFSCKVCFEGYMKKFFVLMILVNLFYWGSSELMEIPARIQVALFTKIFQYDNVLKNKQMIKLLIVYNDKSANLKDDIEQAFSNVSVKTSSVSIDKLTHQDPTYDVIYFMPNINYGTEICRNNKILSISTNKKLVEKGDVTIGLALEQNMPRVLINLTTLSKEGHEMSSQILKIAKVYK